MRLRRGGCFDGAPTSALCTRFGYCGTLALAVLTCTSNVSDLSTPAWALGRPLKRAATPQDVPEKIETDTNVKLFDLSVLIAAVSGFYT